MSCVLAIEMLLSDVSHWIAKPSASLNFSTYAKRWQPERKHPAMQWKEDLRVQFRAQIPLKLPTRSFRCFLIDPALRGRGLTHFLEATPWGDCEQRV